MKRIKKIYYEFDDKGNIKRNDFATYINNHEWVLPVIVIIMIILCGFLDGLCNI